MKLSQEAREQLLEPWEECVLYVYDDKVGKRHIDGKLQYPEWDGGEVKGTLTIGFGHTDAAGAPKIVQDMRISREEADQILSDDIAPCERAVNRLLKASVTQHQFDALVDTYFNCPTAAVAAIRLINAGQARAVPAKLLLYVNSKGERMQGLVNRRNAEIKWWNTPDDVEEAAVDAVFSPKAEASPPPKTMATSKTGTAASAIGLAGIAETMSSVNQALDPVRQAKGTLEELGLFEMLGHAAKNQGVLLGLVIVALAVFVWFDRRYKLINWHV